LALKIESFQNFATIFIISAKNFKFQNFAKFENVGGHNIFNFSTTFLRGREIAQDGDETLPKVLPKLEAKFGKIS